MACFFFDLVRGGAVDRDDVGVELDGLETAYLEAYQAALEISFDMLLRRKDPGGQAFDIRDEAGRILMTLPFSEVLRPGTTARPPPSKDVIVHLRGSIDRSRSLKADLHSGLTQARETVAASRRILQRARSAEGALGSV